MDWNLIGHDWAVDMLSGQIARGDLNHAYLFTGPKGVGRRTLALRFARAINCSRTPEPGAFCGSCRACVGIAGQAHPDLVTVEAEEVGAVLKVEQVRELHHFLSLAPYESAYRIALLLRFEEAQRHAANALLKTLEEPAARVILLLTAESPEHVPETILSRCQLMRLRPLPASQLAQRLEDSLEIPPEEAERLAHLSNGRPGTAMGYHANPDLLSDRNGFLEDQISLLPADRMTRFKYAETAAKDKTRLRAILETWSTYWRDVLILAAGAHTPLTNLDRRDEIRALAQRIGSEQAHKMLDNIERARDRLDGNANTRLAAEILMLAMPHI